MIYLDGIRIWAGTFMVTGLFAGFEFAMQSISLPLWALLMLILAPTAKLVELSTTLMNRADKKASLNNNETENENK